MDSVPRGAEAAAHWLLLCSSHPQPSVRCGRHAYHRRWPIICDGSQGGGRVGGWFKWKIELSQSKFSTLP